MRALAHLPGLFGILPACLLLGGCLAPLAYRPGEAGAIGSPAPAAAMTDPAPQQPLAAPVPQYALDDLLQMSPQGLRELLGEPGLLRREGNGQMWRYVGGECVLFLFLYPVGSEETGPAQVTHAEFGARENGAEPETAGCINALVMRRRG